MASHINYMVLNANEDLLFYFILFSSCLHVLLTTSLWERKSNQLLIGWRREEGEE
jgi:hypothetical protein